jgi:hypothetical protein
MSGPVIIQEFSEENPPSIPALNTMLRSFVAAINGLAASPLLQVGASPVAAPGSLPLSGGSLYGQLTAPSLLIGPVAGPQYEVIHRNSKAGAADFGIVKKAAAVPDLATAISNPPTQAEVTEIKNKINALLASLRAAESLA